MNAIKVTATEHMRRDVDAVAKWICQCEACGQIRSLVGMEKVLVVRPLVRAIEELGARLDGLPPGPDRQRLLEEYLGLHDKLAAAIAE
jgi:hypothetical protein